MPSSRSAAIEAAITTSLEMKEFTIEDVTERTNGESSRRTIRRALSEVEDWGWVEKRSDYAKNWHIGPKAREHRIASRDSGYPDTDLPIMYFVGTNDSSPQDFLFGEFVLLSAGVAWMSSGSGFAIGVPDAEHLLVDSGGYQVATRFGDEYPYSPEAYHEWAENIGGDVVFGMDWACEDADILANVTGEPESNIAPWEDRLEWSFRDQQKQFKEHQQGRYSHEFRPVIQGHDPHHFKEFAKRIKNSNMPTDSVAIGTVCKRSSKDEIHDVTKEVANILPDANIHLFGATLKIWKDERFAELFHSSDSAAWMRHGPTDSMYPTGDDEEMAYRNYKEKVENSVVRNAYEK